MKNEEIQPEFSKSAMKRIFTREGAQRVGDDAAEHLLAVLNILAKEIAHHSVMFARNAGKTTINAEEVREATRLVLSDWGD